MKQFKQTIKKIYPCLFIFFLFVIYIAQFITGILETYSIQVISFKKHITEDELWKSRFTEIVQSVLEHKKPRIGRTVAAQNPERREHMQQQRKYYRRLDELYDNIFYSIFLIILWLFPVYRYNFSKKPQYSKIIEQRVVNFSFFILCLSWGISLYLFMSKLYYTRVYLGEISAFSVGLYFSSFIIFGSITTVAHMGYTQRYANDRIAYPLFRDNALFTDKKGFSFSITNRVALMMLTLGMLPLILNIYILMYFNFDILSDIASVAASAVMPFISSGSMNASVSADNSVSVSLQSVNPANFASEILKTTGQLATLFQENLSVLVPLFFMCIAGGYFILSQIFQVISFKKSIQQPIDKLIERMQLVSNGEFNCKTSVLSSDEIGKLKAHFNTMLDGLVEREKIKDTFGKYVSMEIARKIMESGKVNLAGEEIETTVLFSDIRGFTPLSESMSAVEVVEFLNQYFSYIVKPIHENRGVINKFMGDAVLAVFSPIFGVENHCEAALEAAKGIMKELDKFNAMKKYPPARCGVGIHTGILVAGNIGTDERMEFTVIGDTVNVASRIETQTKAFNADILLSEDVFERVDAKKHQGWIFEPCEPVVMKGKSHSMTLFKVSSTPKAKSEN